MVLEHSQAMVNDMMEEAKIPGWQKTAISKIDISASEQSVSTTKQLKSAKNLFALNRTARLIRATNHSFCLPRL